MKTQHRRSEVREEGVKGSSRNQPVVDAGDPARAITEAEPSGARIACTKAFTDSSGNRFIYPSMVRWPGDEECDRPSKADLILQAMSLELALGATADKGWFEFDPANFPNLRTEVLHPRFMHGGATVLLFAGPVFEAALVKAQQAEALASAERGDAAQVPGEGSRDEPNSNTGDRR